MSARRAVAAGLAALLAATLASCGLPADDEPRAIAEGDIPADLLDPNPTSSTTVSVAAGTTVVVYLLEERQGGNRLVAVEREVTEASTPDQRLAALFGGATKRETDAGLTSGIPVDTQLLSVAVDEEEDEVVVDVSGDLFNIEGAQLAQAFAQIVWTATEPSAGGYTRVRFLVDGESTTVFDADGASTEDAVSRADYSAFSPR